MPQKTLKYSNGDVTIVWKPEVCIHSTLCWNGLIEVFNPKARPWINPQAAPTEKIIEQVRKCPSGALSYYMNAEHLENEEGARAAVGEAAQILKIEVSLNGPYIIRTNCVIKLSDGTEESKDSTVCLCRCGQSQSKPYCDGSHKRVGFVG